MKRAWTLAALLAVGACAGAEEAAMDTMESASQAVADMSASEIGALASRILDDPGRAEELLDEVGISVERLDSLVYDIASDPEATAEYLRALGDGGSD